MPSLFCLQTIKTLCSARYVCDMFVLGHTSPKHKRGSSYGPRLRFGLVCEPSVEYDTPDLSLTIRQPSCSQGALMHSWLFRRRVLYGTVTVFLLTLTYSL